MASIHVADFAYADGMHDDTSSVQAAVLGADTLNPDSTSRIQSAIDAANEGDEIAFSCRTYLIKSPITLKKCTYNGNGATLMPFPGVEFDCWWSDDPTLHPVFRDMEQVGVCFTHFHFNGGLRVHGGMIYR